MHILLFYPPVVPTPVPVTTLANDGSELSMKREQVSSDSESESGSRETCSAEGVCRKTDTDTDADDERRRQDLTNGKDRDGINKKDDSDSNSRESISAELLEGMKPLARMDRVVTSVAERFRGR